MVGPDSRRVSRDRRYLGVILGKASSFAYRAVTVFGGPFQGPSARLAFVKPPDPRMGRMYDPSTPGMQCMRAWHMPGLG